MHTVVAGRAARRAAPTAVAALGQPDHRRIDLGQMPAGLADQGRQMLPPEYDRDAFGIVLVAVAGRRRCAPGRIQ
jgi:hypothetical protein